MEYTYQPRLNRLGINHQLFNHRKVVVMFASKLSVKISVLANTLLVGLFSANVNAALTSYTQNGVNYVYSSESDVTWTKDANLLGSMIFSKGFNTVIDAIILASPTVNSAPNSFDGYTGTYNISSADFDNTNLGITSWFGAVAFVNYLNTISYGGSNQWKLPTFDNDIGGFNTPSNGNLSGNELSELYYQELGGAINSNSIANSSYFTNVGYFYHSATEFGQENVWGFSTGDGSQNYNGKGYVSFYAWAVTEGTVTGVSSVPAPAAVWLFVSGLPILAAACRRKKQTV